jgi:glycosyltransferase involved in cell wall biosynthesis
MPKISIIIPVFNRQDLVGATLDSILIQTFTDWECILVDDHSSDSSIAVMESYQKKDHRFKVYKRPNELKKGANSCRNFGFTKSKGSYVKWFDSDDLMLPNHLVIAYETLIENNLDFVVTESLNFDHETKEFMGKPYEFDKTSFSITAENLALIRIGWITDDFLGTREIIKNIKYNEYITDGDEYNFFIKLLHHSVKGTFVRQILTHRRIHSDAISFKNKENDIQYLSIIATLKFQTAQDLVIHNNSNLIRWFLSGYMQYSFKLAMSNNVVPYRNAAFRLICNYYSYTKGISFVVSLVFARYCNKGYNMMKYARK